MLDAAPVCAPRPRWGVEISGGGLETRGIKTGYMKFRRVRVYLPGCSCSRARTVLISRVSDVSEFKLPAINTEKRLQRGREVISKRTVRRSTFVCGSGHCYRTVQPWPSLTRPGFTRPRYSTILQIRPLYVLSRRLYVPRACFISPAILGPKLFSQYFNNDRTNTRFKDYGALEFPIVPTRALLSAVVYVYVYIYFFSTGFHRIYRISTRVENGAPTRHWRVSLG